MSQIEISEAEAQDLVLALESAMSGVRKEAMRHRRKLASQTKPVTVNDLSFHTDMLESMRARHARLEALVKRIEPIAGDMG